MGVLAIQTPEDGLLGALAPLGLGAAAGTALVVDLDPDGPQYPGQGTLARLIEDGPRMADLQPQRRGLAVIRNGGIEAAAAAEILAAFSREWPHLVLRLPPRTAAPAGFPLVTVHPLVPGRLFEWTDGSVYQDMGFRVRAPEGARRLPVLGRAVAGSLLAGTIPLRSRWVQAWRSLWGSP